MAKRLDTVSQLRRERERLRKELARVERQLKKELRARKKKGLRQKTKRIKERQKKLSNLKRTIRSVTRLYNRNKKLKQGTAKQRRTQSGKKNLTDSRKKKYGEQKVFIFNGYNQTSNFNAIENYLTELLRRSKSQRKIIRVRINVDALFRGKPEGDSAVRIKGTKQRYGFSVFSATLKNPTIQDVYSHYGTFDFTRIIQPYTADIVRNSKTGNLRIFKVIVTATIT